MVVDNIITHIKEKQKNISENKAIKNTITKELIQNSENPVMSENNLWKLTLKEDDYSEQEVFKDTTSQNKGISKSLEAGKRIVADIFKEVLKYNCEEIPLDCFTNEQTFSYEGRRFILKDINLFNEIEYIRSERNTVETYKKIVNSRKTPLLKGLTTLIAENMEKLSHPIVTELTKQMDNTTVAKLIINVMNTFLREKLSRTSHNKFWDYIFVSLIKNLLLIFNSNYDNE